MLETLRISEIAREVAHERVVGANLERIFTEPSTDSEGNDAIRITLVLKPNAARNITGDNALDVLVGIQRQLWDEGEERLPIIEYATEQELALDQAQDEACGDGYEA